MSGYPFALGLCLVTLGFIIHLLRSRRLREKYAVIWLVVIFLVAVLGAFPRLLGNLAKVVGVETPTNLLFAASLVVLLLVCMQMSMEISQLEEETRSLAEEIAILAYRVDAHLVRVAKAPIDTSRPSVPDEPIKPQCE